MSNDTADDKAVASAAVDQALDEEKPWDQIAKELKITVSKAKAYESNGHRVRRILRGRNRTRLDSAARMNLEHHAGAPSMHQQPLDQAASRLDDPPESIGDR